MLAEHAIESPELVRKLPPSLEVQDRDHLPQVLHDALFALLNGPAPATALFCVQDLLGLAALKYAEEMDLKVPDDLEIVTFNDWPPHWLGRPWQAHRIAVQPADMGQAAIARLMAQIHGTAGDLAKHHIPTVFIPADSLVGSTYDLNLDRPREVL
jgi:DNA-binding LacI/PurR family transcriptional regulator